MANKSNQKRRKLIKRKSQKSLKGILSFCKTFIQKIKTAHYKVIFLVTLALIIIGLLFYKVSVANNSGTSKTNNVSINESNKKAPVTPSIQQAPWSKTELKRILSQQTKIPEGSLIFDVTEMIIKNGQYYLYGALGEKGVTGGKHFYVLYRRKESAGVPKTQTNIQILYIGESQPKCNIFSGYDVPSAWLNRCKK